MAVAHDNKLIWHGIIFRIERWEDQIGAWVNEWMPNWMNGGMKSERIRAKYKNSYHIHKKATCSHSNR